MRHFLSKGSVALGVVFALSSAAYGADVVILDSSVAALASGDVVAEEQSVAIPAGESVTLVMSDGETRVVSGPYDGPIGAAGSAGAGGVGLLAAGRGGETKVLGAVRAPKWEQQD